MPLYLKDRKNERMYNYAHSYTCSAIVLLETMGKNSGKVAPFDIKVKKEDIVLPSLFLMSHGTELFLKIFYWKISGKVPGTVHGISLLKVINEIDRNLLKPLKPHMKEIKELLSRYEKMRYPYAKDFNALILEQNKFLRYWNEQKQNETLSKFKSIRDLLNKIACELLTTAVSRNKRRSFSRL